MSPKKSRTKKHKSRKARVGAKSKKEREKRRGRVQPRELQKPQRSRGVEFVELEERGLGTRAAAGSGDMQDIPTIEDATSESAEELLEAGQSFEAAFVSGVEDAPPADKSPVRTREVPSDDVPLEYQERRPTLGTQEED